MNLISDKTEVKLDGITYANCQGVYRKHPTDTIKGKPVWDRTDGKMFGFYNGSKWTITGSQWRDGIVQKQTGGYFIASTNKVDDFVLTKWDKAEMKNVDGSSLDDDILVNDLSKSFGVLGAAVDWVGQIVDNVAESKKIK